MGLNIYVYDTKNDTKETFDLVSKKEFENIAPFLDMIKETMNVLIDQVIVVGGIAGIF